jgi:hypothetical protein
MPGVIPGFNNKLGPVNAGLFYCAAFFKILFQDFCAAFSANGCGVLQMSVYLSAIKNIFVYVT